MSMQPGSSSRRSVRRGVLLTAALLPLAACATDELALAPASPDRPWAIPPSLTDLPPPGSSPMPPPAKETAPAASVAASPLAAEPGRQYDLAGLIDLAQRNNPDTREAWEKARQAALAVGLNEAAYVPQISAEVISGFQHTPLPIPTTLIPQGYFTTDTRELVPTLTAKWLLFDFGGREGAVREARANAFVANVAFTGAHQKLIYAVSRDYFALGAAHGRLTVAETALKTAEVVQDASETRQAHGLATSVEVAQARRQTAAARFALERARAADHAARAALVASVGIGPGVILNTQDTSTLPLPDATGENLDQVLHDALAARPDIVAANGKIQAAEAALNGAQASYYPTVGLEAQGYENIGGLSTQGSRYYTVNQPGANILLKLSVPVFDGGIRDARVAAARSEVSAAHAALAAARNDAVEQVTDAYDALKTSFAEYTAAVALTEAAHTAYDAAYDAYEHGVGTYTDLVNTETALAQADSDKEDAHANVFTAAAALAFATGAGG